MDYEKAYKAVLKTAKQWIKDGCTDKEKICLECVFPELRESEDERMYKDIRSIILQHYDRLMSYQVCCERKAEFVQERDKMLAYLEKKKENPKNAISIPADCASNAKCEDRWHKTANSLPDDGRDVLAKDAIGNYLLASFDGAQWFVSVYDGEDHPVLHTPPILEWCEIPSEKQKEQKPAEKPSMLELLREHLVNTPKEQLDSEFEELKEFTIPKPVEWREEDERRIDAICELLENTSAIHPNYSHRKLIIWLKSLRPSWKPSEEQMKALEIAFRKDGDDNYRNAINSLYNDLKKLSL